MNDKQKAEVLYALDLLECWSSHNQQVLLNALMAYIRNCNIKTLSKLLNAQKVFKDIYNFNGEEEQED